MGLRDSLGKALFDPPDRTALPLVSRACPELAHDQTVEIVASPAYAWRKLVWSNRMGSRGCAARFLPGRRGTRRRRRARRGNLSDRRSGFRSCQYPAGPRFAGEDAPLGGRLGALCQRLYERADHPGISRWASRCITAPARRKSFARSSRIRRVATATSDWLRHGDVERALMEWRSLLRHIAAAPALEWDRWMALKSAARELLGRVATPAFFDFPPLLATQQRRA